MPLQPVVLDHHVLTFDVASLIETFAECCRVARGGICRPAANESDHQHGRLLRPRRERPRRHTAEQRDEIAPLHSITSSAMASTPDGTSMLSARAVCRLMANSNLVDCSTGSSAGFSPLRILPA